MSETQDHEHLQYNQTVLSPEAIGRIRARNVASGLINWGTAFLVLGIIIGVIMGLVGISILINSYRDDMGSVLILPSALLISFGIIFLLIGLLINAIFHWAAEVLRTIARIEEASFHPK